MREDKGFEISKFTDEEIAPDENIGIVKGLYTAAMSKDFAW